MENYFKLNFNLARNALRFVLKYYKICKIHIPYYLCPAVKNAIKCENVEIEFYHITDDFLPDREFNSNDFILYPNYFGICAKNVEIFSKKYKNLIVDNAQAYFMQPISLASFNSPRKFFFHSCGLKDGAELFLRNVQNLAADFPLDEYSYQQTKNDFSYVSLLKNEKRIEANSEPKQMSFASKKILETVDFRAEREKRLNKFYELDEKYGHQNELKIKLGKNDVPFVYPMLTFDDELAEKIVKEHDYILRYWTNLPDSYNEYKFYKYLLPVPIL